MKIALYRCISLDYEAVYSATDYFENNDDHVRISEIVDVDFPMLDNSDAVQKQVDFIDKQIKTVQAAAESKVTELKHKKAELLALPDKSNEHV